MLKVWTCATATETPSPGPILRHPFLGILSEACDSVLVLLWARRWRRCRSIQKCRYLWKSFARDTITGEFVPLERLKIKRSINSLTRRVSCSCGAPVAFVVAHPGPVEGKLNEEDFWRGSSLFKSKLLFKKLILGENLFSEALIWSEMKI